MIYIYTWTDGTYISHHGILGQKWGVRRYQNKDGSLTEAGKKRISKQYLEYQSKGDRKLLNNNSRMYVDAYNKAVNDMNNGLTEQYNKSKEEKYGADFVNRADYEEDYEKLFNSIVDKYYSKNLYDFLKSDRDYKKASELVNKYGMLEWDEIAKNNSEGIEAIKKRMK